MSRKSIRLENMEKANKTLLGENKEYDLTDHFKVTPVEGDKHSFNWVDGDGKTKLCGPQKEDSGLSDFDRALGKGGNNFEKNCPPSGSGSMRMVGYKNGRLMYKKVLVNQNW